ncbi:MAG: ATP synthase F1 subunit gamma [bacterium]
MQTLREIKQRIKGVTNIQQITRAMEMVAGTKLKRAQLRTESARPYAEGIGELLKGLLGSMSQPSHPLFCEREIHHIGIGVITSEKGLCGPYNSLIIRNVFESLADYSLDQIKFILLGRKGFLHLQRRGYHIEKYYPGGIETFGYPQIGLITRDMIAGYEAGVYDAVELFYTRLETVMVSQPGRMRLLPIEREELRPNGEREYILEPSADVLLAELIPRYLEARVHQAVLESYAAELAARRLAMKAATDNAEEMIEELTRSYNKARQESITKEILEVVSGAEALRG